jgi:hypothetical protein
MPFLLTSWRYLRPEITSCWTLNLTLILYSLPSLMVKGFSFRVSTAPGALRSITTSGRPVIRSESWRITTCDIVHQSWRMWWNKVLMIYLAHITGFTDGTSRGGSDTQGLFPAGKRFIFSIFMIVESWLVWSSPSRTLHQPWEMKSTTSKVVTIWRNS